MLADLSNRVLDLLAPQRCIYCDQPSGSELPLCGVCEGGFIANRRPCPRCALPDCAGSLCPTCLAQPPLLTSTTAPLVYDIALAYFMHRWKYLKDPRLASIGAHLIAKYAYFSKTPDIILPTPLHWRRLLQRGFNQSEDLLKALARKAPQLRSAISTAPLRLQRVKATAPQAASSRKARLGNLEDAFRLRGDVRGLSVAIVDDVCTTGATANAMAATLRAAGATEVHLLCIARTPGR
jgi:ComF family protein